MLGEPSIQLQRGTIQQNTKTEFASLPSKLSSVCCLAVFTNRDAIKIQERGVVCWRKPKKNRETKASEAKEDPGNNIEDLSSATQDVNEDVTPSMFSSFGMPYQNYQTEANM